MDFILLLLAAAGGYVLSIFTWSHIRTLVVGAEAEAAALRTRATALLAGIRSKV